MAMAIGNWQLEMAIRNGNACEHRITWNCQRLARIFFFMIGFSCSVVNLSNLQELSCCRKYRAIHGSILAKCSRNGIC